MVNFPGMSLEILVLSDLHYARGATSVPDVRSGRFARLFFRKALRKLAMEGVTPDLILLLGDLLDDARAPAAERELTELAEEILKAGIRVLAIPGNHDDFDSVAKIFNCPPGLHVAGDYGFLLYHDEEIPEKLYQLRRTAGATGLAEKCAREHPGLNLITVQHAPLVDVVPERHRVENAGKVCAEYNRANVLLALAGHTHGHYPDVLDGVVRHITVPAFCEAPFSFLHLRLDGRNVTAARHTLKLPDGLELFDTHCHTGFAYCADGTETARDQEVAEVLGLHGLAFTEHAFQLYLGNPPAWKFAQWVDDPSVLEAVWQTPHRGRMEAYKHFIATQRRPTLLAGLEVDLFDHGRLALAPQDAGDWDLLIGAMHYMQDYEPGRNDADFDELFLRDLRALLGHGVDVLAHPFRICSKRYGQEAPRHLYGEVAGMLAEAGVVAEVNFHNYPPDREFFALCMERGVKLSFGTDAHSQPYIADLHPHIRFLESLGVSRRNFGDVLLNPKRLPRRQDS